jgi:TIR domain-containing protein
MPRIFISYRRSDSRTFVGRVYDQLVREFGPSNIFRDVDDIPPGSDFREILEREVAQCDVLLVMMGATWANATNDQGQKRLENPDDFVRIEVESALRLRDKRVIPVLVGGANMPSEAELPSATLKRLPYLNAVSLRDDPDFRHDMENLIAFLKTLDSQSTATPTAPTSQPISVRSGINPKILVAIIIVIIVAIAAIIGIPAILNQQPTPTSTVLISTSTNTPQPPTNTDAPTSTEAVPTNTDVPVQISESVSLAIDPMVVQRGQDVNITTSGTVCTFNPSNGDPFTIQTSSGNITWKAERQPGTTIDVYCEKDDGRSETVTFQVGPLTNTPNPPTNTPPLPTPTISSSNTITIAIFRDQDSLTLYVPDTDEQVSLEGLTFNVTTFSGEIIKRLDRDYLSFIGITFHNLPTPICFRLVRSGSGSPTPLVCQIGGLLLTQQLADADIFWYESTSNQDRTVGVLKDGNYIGLCGAGQTRCDVDLPFGQ